MSLDKLEFVPNVPQHIALKFPTGKRVEGRFGDQVFFTLAQPAETCLYLDEDHAAQINALGLRRNEPFWLCKRWTGKKSDKPVWEAWTDAGEPPARPAPSPASVATGIPDSDLEQRLRASLADIERRKAGASVSAPAPVVAAPEPSRQQTPPHINGNGNKNGAPPNGTNGAPRPYEAAGIPAPASPLVKIPMDVAFGQILGWMKAQLEANHIQWNDAAQQDLVSTAIIGGMREGWITVWRRGGVQ